MEPAALYDLKKVLVENTRLRKENKQLKEIIANYEKYMRGEV